MRMRMVSAKYVTALQRGLIVMETVNEFGPIGLSSVHQKCGLPKATVLRMLETLCAQGYIQFDVEKKLYQIGARSLALSNKFSFESHSFTIIRPVVAKLREKLGWPSDVAIFQHDKMVIVDTNRKPGTLSSNRTIGSRVPMMASATGRAYLSAINKNERDKIILTLRNSMDPFEEKAKNEDFLNKIILETQSRGYALSNQEFLPGNIGAAVPIIYGKNVVCVINLIALAKISPLEKVQSENIPLLLQAKHEIEEALNN